MTAREHLAAMHHHESDFRKTLSEQHASEAKRHKDAGDLASSRHHERMADECMKSSQFHSRCAEQCAESAKAERDQLEKTRIPDRITSVVTTDAPSGAFGINDRTAVRAVPRVGAPGDVLSKADRAAIPARFSHLISSMEEGE
jgi:hypothetical protein